MEQEIGLGRKLKGFANRRRTEANAWKWLARCASATWNGMLVQRRIGNGTDARKLGVVTIVNHDVVSRDVEQEIGCEQFKFVNTYRPSQSFFSLPCSISLSHTIGYNARVELSPALKENAPLNI